MKVSPYNAKLLAAIQATLPNVPIVSVFLRNGRWWAASSRGSAHSVQDILNSERESTMRRKAEAWRANLTDQTAEDVRAMCRRLLRGNPRNRFVREQYPHLYSEITAEQQTATTHQGNYNGTEL